MKRNFMLFNLLPSVAHKLLIMYVRIYTSVVVMYVPCGNVAKLAVGTELHEDEFKDRCSSS